MSENGLKISPIFGNGMILQRDTINYIYGSDSQVEEVAVIFMGSEYTAKVDENYEFQIALPPIKAGGPYDLKIIGSSEITITDILFGDVYICSGQSNMEMPIRGVLRVSEEEVKDINEPEIRQYHIPATYNFATPEKYMVKSSWKKAQGEDLLNFSAVGYFFAKEIKETYEVPIGLIMSAVGGSTVEAWMNPTTLQRFGDYEKQVEEFKDINYFNSYIQNQQKAAAEWKWQIEKEEDKYRFDEEYKEWNICHVPSLVSDYSEEPFQGSVYLCKEIVLEEEPEEEITLSMGAIIDSDMIWVNGTLIGRTEFRYPPRVYTISKGLLKKGLNLITIRIVINNGNGGTIKGMPYYLKYGNQLIDLEGDWYYRIGKVEKLPVPNVLFPPLLPICFYHTVVVPLSKVAVKGVLWYQGESNTGEPYSYAEKFAAMVTDWRTLFGSPIPFLYVQLTNYRDPLNTVEDTGWAEIREQQRRGLSLEHVAMVVTVDIGEHCDLHPQNKKEVGVRMAKAAHSLIYKKDEILSSPLPEGATVKGSEVTIAFQYLGENQTYEGINNFEIAGIEGIYYRATATRSGKYITASCEKVDKPTSIRYAWYDNPTDINFYNEYNLPAPTFRLEL
jgi:sialate O-acetylesterase